MQWHRLQKEAHSEAIKIGDIGLLSPVRLQEDAVDVVDVNGPARGANSFEQTSKAEVASFSKHAFGGVDDQVEGLLWERAVPKAKTVELAIDGSLNVVVMESL